MKSDGFIQIYQTDAIGVPVQGSSIPIEDTIQGRESVGIGLRSSTKLVKFRAYLIDIKIFWQYNFLKLDNLPLSRRFGTHHFEIAGELESVLLGNQHAWDRHREAMKH